MKKVLGIFLSLVVILSLTTSAWAAQDIASAFQVRYAANLNIGESFVNITNAGTAGGNICVNIYAFAPDEQEISCCACTVTPNALVTFSVKGDILDNTLTPATPTSVTIKLLASTGGPCNAAKVTTLAGGLRAWGTTLHATPTAGTYAVTETEFSPAVLSASEFSRITDRCQDIQENGSGFGICRACRAGGQ